MKIFKQIVFFASANARQPRDTSSLFGVEKMVQHWTEIEVEKLQDYGCASRGYFDSTDPAVGLPVDEIDRSFIWWKKCIKCARSEYSAYDLEYNHFDYAEMYEYDSDIETCGKNYCKGKFSNVA